MEHDLAIYNLPESWQLTFLGELLDRTGGSVQTGPFGSQLHASDYVDTGIPSVMPKNISVEKIDSSDIARVSQEDIKRLAKYQLAEGDIVYSRRGDVEKCALVGVRENGWLCGTGCLRVRLGEVCEISPVFLHAYLSSPAIREWISRNAIGATMPNLNTSILRDVPLLIPDQETIKMIESCWENINKRLVLSESQNQTLEQMAQALFKSWFVDFDPVVDNALAAGNPIPDELAHRVEVRKKAHALPDFKPLPEHIRNLFPNELERTGESTVGIDGWVPKGWGKTSFESLIKLIGGGTPKTSVEEYWNGKIPWFSVVDAPKDSDVFVLDTEKHISQLGVDNSSTKILRKGTTVISARGTVGKCALVGEPMAMNQSCYGIEGKTGIADTFIYFLTRYQVSDLQKRGHGSVFNTITRETFKTINLAFSGEELTLAFESLVKPYLDRILLNNRQVLELIRTRDVLLPKLISGEIKIDKEVA